MGPFPDALRVVGGPLHLLLPAEPGSLRTPTVEKRVGPPLQNMHWGKLLKYARIKAVVVFGR